MRLRLSVHRNGLPPTNILWNAPNEGKTTISQLLEQLNDIVPLEDYEWGLEDYKVTVGGYECLHYQELCHILKDEDEVSILPLESTDRKARRQAGRHQITADGRHLIDGVPFGRRLMVKIQRPPVYIPPLKRRRSEIEEPFQGHDDHIRAVEAGPYESYGGPLQIMEAPRNLREGGDDRRVSFTGLQEGEGMSSPLPPIDSDEEDDDFVPGSPEDERSDSLELDGSASPEVESSYSNSESETSSASESDSESDSGSSSSSYDSSEASDDSQDLSDTELPQVRPSEVKRKDIKTSDAPATKRRQPSHEHDNTIEPTSKRVKMTQPTPTNMTESILKKTPPGAGSVKTRFRNARKRDVKKLQYLKKIGELPQDASREDLLRYMGTNNWTGHDAGAGADRNEDTNKQDTPLTNGDGSLLNGVNSLMNGGSANHSPAANVTNGPHNSQPIEVSSSSSEDSSSDSDSTSDSESESDSEGEAQANPTQVNPPKSAKSDSGDSKSASSSKNSEVMSEAFIRKRQQLLDAIASGGIDITAFQNGDNTSTTNHTMMAETTSNGDGHSSPPEIQSSKLSAEEIATPPTESTKRKRLDIAASGRLLLGSLGVRVPKSSADREKLQQKLAAAAQRKPITKPTPATTTTSSAPAPTTTSSGYNADDDASNDPDFWKSRINLTAFECVEEGVVLSTPPFPFYQRWDPQQQRSTKRRKRPATTSDAQRRHDEGDHVDYYNLDGAGDALPYDDEEEAAEDPRGYGAEEAAFTEGKTDDDLPPLPQDLSALRECSAADVVRGDVIVFRKLEVSAATNWQPALSGIRTACVESVIVNGEGEVETLELRLAQRDQPPRRYDADGVRVYEKFEMKVGEEDEEEGVLEMEWRMLVEPRRFRREGEEGDGETVRQARERWERELEEAHGMEAGMVTWAGGAVATAER
ncbi:hypothetical protein M8818_003389 [Zalaria obscura]|uniref:Uncharacterized protein n=1 Tax=Zalaria obscura TaxID=2024903 RepID=A0ACC3SFK9_9PEZI